MGGLVFRANEVSPYVYSVETVETVETVDSILLLLLLILMFITTIGNQMNRNQIFEKNGGKCESCGSQADQETFKISRSFLISSDKPTYAIICAGCADGDLPPRKTQKVVSDTNPDKFSKDRVIKAKRDKRMKAAREKMRLLAAKPKKK